MFAFSFRMFRWYIFVVEFFCMKNLECKTFYYHRFLWVKYHFELQFPASDVRFIPRFFDIVFAKYLCG